MIKDVINFIFSLADQESDTDDEKRQHSFLIFIGTFMSLGGLTWGSIALISGLPLQAAVPFGYVLITLINFIYLNFSKNFHLAQTVQLFISLMLPFLFQISLGGFVSSGAQVFWSILAILGAFTFKHHQTIISWFIFYIILIIISGLIDNSVTQMELIEVPQGISTLFFTLNIVTLSFIIFALFYYFVGSEEKYRESLKENLQTLQNTQVQLIEAEKMSSLGGLVAGVAHEVNTPLGISITAASIFKTKLNNLEAAIAENRLSKSDLENAITDMRDADEILIKNLDRAAVLIKNFKKISVDQSSEDIRHFELNDYIKEVISTFHNELKHNHVTLNLELEANEIHMHSYPGAIAQIIINLLQNAIVHAFEGNVQKVITLQTRQQEDNVIITCFDNGKGIDASVSDRIFEPFVTTKRNKGGTGLGLNITYNLVTQHLKGTIKLAESSQTGACFVISIPKSVQEESY